MAQVPQVPPQAHIPGISESEEDSLGVSADSETAAARKRSGKAAARAPAPAAEDNDLLEYAESLGADLSDADLAWVVGEAFEAPLPIGWTEHIDADGRVYFFNQVNEASTWSHPMDGVYRELIDLIQSVKREPNIPP